MLKRLLTRPLWSISDSIEAKERPLFLSGYHEFASSHYSILVFYRSATIAVANLVLVLP